MAWPNPFRRQDENTRHCWGYTFQLTKEHLTPEQTLPLKFSYDVLGEKALERLNILSPPAQPLILRKVPPIPEKPNQEHNASPDHGKADHTVTVPKRDLYNLLRDNAGTDAVLGELWAEANRVPPWVNWDQVARGQDVFYRYGGPALTGLAFQSLLGGLVRDHDIDSSNSGANESCLRVLPEWLKY